MQSFMASLQVFIRPTHRHLCRAFSTSLILQDASESFALPPARLRALITLYHQSSSFITPANLSAKIDHAFTDARLVPTITTSEASHAELQERLKARRNANEVGPGKTQYRGIPLDLASGQTWSDRRGARQSRVANALWGTESNGKPALETVLETSRAGEELNTRLAETETRRRPSRR